MKNKTLQENVWQSSFGDKYVKRNTPIGYDRMFNMGTDLIESKIKIKSALELGCNVGWNLNVLRRIYGEIDIHGVEINKSAYEIAKKNFKCTNKSLLEFNSKKKYDLVFTSGVLIHQNPRYLKKIYNKMYSLSKKYIYLSEYFSDTPEMIVYRGKKNLLFKRDFAKEIWKLFPQLKLINYGFHWKEDPIKKNICDNNTWFLFSK